MIRQPNMNISFHKMREYTKLLTECHCGSYLGDALNHFQVQGRKRKGNFFNNIHKSLPNALMHFCFVPPGGGKRILSYVRL